MSKAGCEHPDVFPDIGMVAPKLLYTNIAKYMFANNQHEQSKLLVDIAGGLATDAFCYKDRMNPKERPFLEKYLAAKMVCQLSTGFAC